MCFLENIEVRKLPLSIYYNIKISLPTSIPGSLGASLISTVTRGGKAFEDLSRP